MKTIHRVVFVSALGVMWNFALAARCVDEERAAGNVQEPMSHITVSTDTTRITGPLRADGCVDYIAAINQYASAGVTPENNAVVLMVQAFGPRRIRLQSREQYFAMLGISPLPEEGSYFVDYYDYAARVRPTAAPNQESRGIEEQKLCDEMVAAMSSPWTEESLPVVAAWLEESQQFFTLIVEATKRQRWYEPLIATGDQPTVLVALIQPMEQPQRRAAQLLEIRAMYRLGHGKVDEAWEDLVACHRLGRLTAQGGGVVEMLRGIAIDGVACGADQVILAHGGLTASQARRMHDDLDKLPPLPTMVDAIDVGERYMFLDFTQALAARGLGWLNKVDGGEDESGTLEELFSKAGALVVNWDEVLRIGNDWHDRVLAALGKPTLAARRAAIEQMDAELMEYSKNVKDVPSLAVSMLAGPSLAVSERVGHFLIAMLSSGHPVCSEVEARAIENLEVTKVAFLLAAYRAEHGKFPAQLSDLTPQYLAEVPMDPFSGNPLIYKPHLDGYVLYSVGVNGKDDSGLGYGDRPEGKTLDYDDLVVRVPLQQ